MRITAVASTDLFAGTTQRPLQLIRVTVAGEGGSPGQAAVRVEGPGVSTPQPVTIGVPGPGQAVTAEVAVTVAAPHGPGSRLAVTAIAEAPAAQAGPHPARAQLAADITVAEPGWTMWMVSHFHYDPVWWSTQGQFTESRLLLPDTDGRLPDIRTAFELVRLHLDEARRDPDYKFVLAEIDYLKPHFDAHPEDRADLLAFIASGRIEIVGGSYNEPNTNLTSAESTIRNALYGLAYQRDILGADPQSAWMLDAFGHDPSYPGLMAAAGLTSSAWARGPFHQWGPQRSVGDNTRMQFASEFEWVSPDGGGLLTAYMPNHYGAGWVTAAAPDLAAAEAAAYEQFSQLAPVAATRNVLLPVGADHVIPSRWATGIHRDWNSRYVWPRFVTAVPGEFFTAVRADAAERDVWITPQTRDMNPVYTGKDVSYIDTKQGQRAAETAVEDGERLATLAWLAGADYPAAELDKAWRQLVYGAHHDAITGTEGDQVYLDLLAGWQEAHQRGARARDDAAAYLAARADTRPPGPVSTAVSAAVSAASRAIVVFSTLSAPRPGGMVTVTLGFADPGTAWVSLADDTGAGVPFLATGERRHGDGTLAELTLTFRACDVPALGYRTYWAAPADTPAQPAGWRPAGGTIIENEAFLAEADPAAGGTLRRITDKRSGTELLSGPGNELVVQEEHASHPKWGEGPWLLTPKGPGTGSAAQPAPVRAESCPVGRRLVSETSIGELRFVQETVLWDGSDRVEFRTHADGSIGSDRLLRVRFPARVPGALPVYQAAVTAVGRPFGAADADVARDWYTLDNPAHEWFGLSSAARVAVTAPDGARVTCAIGVAEVIAPDILNGLRAPIRDLLAALAARGVTATCSRPDGPRYGSIDLDSNLPDVRIVLGGPGQNQFAAAAVAGAGPAAAGLLTGTGRLWLAAERSREDAFAPGADVRGLRDLPVLIVAGADGTAAGLAAAIAALVTDLDGPAVEAVGPVASAGPRVPDLAGHSVALLNRGTPSSLVTPGGTLHISLMRSCSAWPCGVWIDGEARTTPDGTSFAWQHWSHTFEYALAAGPGDWRAAGFPLAGLDYNRGLLATVTGLHGGPLPGRASLASAEPATAVLSALKPRGNPLATGRPGTPDRADGVIMRLRDVSGGTGPATALARLAPGLAAAASAGLADEAPGPALTLRDGAAVVPLPVASTATLALTPQPSTVQPSTVPTGTVAGGAEAGGVELAEAAQPVFTRYWLHGKGPAPAGGLPVAVHLSGDAGGGTAAQPGGAARVALEGPGGTGAVIRLTVACGPEPAAGLVTLDVPGPLEADPPGPLRFDLPARGYASWDLRVRARRGAAGRYFVAARISDPGGGEAEDAALVTVGELPPPQPGLPLAEFVPEFLAEQQRTVAELGISLDAAELVLVPGGRGEIAVRLASGTASELRGEAQLICPFGQWGRAGQWAGAEQWAGAGMWTQGFTVGPGQETVLRYPVAAPATARPGTCSWALVKVMYFGRVRYSPTIAYGIADRVSSETLGVLASTSERP